MIQFNLLPDVKKEYVKAKRMKRLIISAATLISAGSVAVTVLMFSFVRVGQSSHINALTDDIKNTNKKIQNTPNINSILTVQNQLSLLTELHEKKPETSRVFNYLAYVSPAAVRITAFDLDTLNNRLQLEGTADTIVTINKFVDNLEAVVYAQSGNTAEEKKVFSNVLTELSGTNDGASFTITMSFESAIFDNKQQVILRLGSQAPTTTQTGGGQ